jgi:hypothetical protein
MKILRVPNLRVDESSQLRTHRVGARQTRQAAQSMHVSSTKNSPGRLPGSRSAMQRHTHH